MDEWCTWPCGTDRCWEQSANSRIIFKMSINFKNYKSNNSIIVKTVLKFKTKIQSLSQGDTENIRDIKEFIPNTEICF